MVAQYNISSSVWKKCKIFEFNLSCMQCHSILSFKWNFDFQKKEVVFINQSSLVMCNNTKKIYFALRKNMFWKEITFKKTYSNRFCLLYIYTHVSNTLLCQWSISPMLIHKLIVYEVLFKTWMLFSSDCIKELILINISI
jgi:hypothetical protein